MKKLVLLLNLGGPKKANDIQSFLFNLFLDKRIVKLPKFIRYILASIISFSRRNKAKKIYSLIDYKNNKLLGGNKECFGFDSSAGGSTILQETLSQALDLEMMLNYDSTDDYMVLPCMRHFAPTIHEIKDYIAKYSPDEIILLSMYPQYSTTTTLSSVEQLVDFFNYFEGGRFKNSIKTISSYHNHALFLEYFAQKILPHVCFSASYLDAMPSAGVPSGLGAQSSVSGGASSEAGGAASSVSVDGFSATSSDTLQTLATGGGAFQTLAAGSTAPFAAVDGTAANRAASYSVGSIPSALITASSSTGSTPSTDITASPATFDNKQRCIIFFSAHSLPLKIIQDGDPYQMQVEEGANGIVNILRKIGADVSNKQINLSDNLEKLDLDSHDVHYVITYQSKIGPVKWLGPATEDCLEIAVKIFKKIIVVPIAFTCEHVETLVELDVEYKEIADAANVEYVRIPTPRNSAQFIDLLKQLVVYC